MQPRMTRSCHRTGSMDQCYRSQSCSGRPWREEKEDLKVSRWDGMGWASRSMQFIATPAGLLPTIGSRLYLGLCMFGHKLVLDRRRYPKYNDQAVCHYPDTGQEEKTKQRGCEGTSACEMQQRSSLSSQLSSAFFLLRCLCC